ncbi:type 12 methyltransferase [Salmonella enterica subsp. enterica]|uniref:Type 12 methyltransferase n=1 Tax=Salmonella enterica I TaxID=59201 RepID=A0A379WVC0_SALET|nr:type 12 methyltransferase [Salmonella enterica subsp. enterica]
MKHTQQSGAKVYNPFTLSLYDWWVLNISNKYAWKCPTDTRLLPFFLHHMGETHLDIGVGTGYYLKHAPATHAISLMDLNPDSLKIAASRVGNTKIPRHTTTRCFRHVPGGLGTGASIPFRCTIFCTAYR